MSKLGLVSVSFRSLSPIEVFEAAKEAKLSCIEWGSDVHAPCNDERRLKEIKSLSESFGIECSSYGTYFRIGQNETDEILPYINAAKILGTDTLRVWCGIKGSQMYSQNELDAFYRDCHALASIAAENKVTLCMECHNDTLTDTVGSALNLMKEINSPFFKMYWQPNQHRTYEENLIYAEKIAPFAENIHIFNWLGNNKFPLIEAEEQWTQYLKKIPDSKNLLLEFMPDGKVESLNTEADSLRKIVGGLI